MHKTEPHYKLMDHAEIARYVINGLFATGVHFSVLTFNLQIYDMQSAGLANLIAAVFGITVSFLGSRYFVFKNHQDPFLNQAMVFALLYASIACLHGLVVYEWSDVYGFDYRTGFIMATIMQVMMSYFGNKSLVFNT